MGAENSVPGSLQQEEKVLDGTFPKVPDGVYLLSPLPLHFNHPQFHSSQRDLRGSLLPL